MAVTTGLYGLTARAAEPIPLVSILDLEGSSRQLGRRMRVGIEAALHGAVIGGRPVRLHFLNDSYTPSLTRDRVQQALALKAVAVIGNTGTPTAAVSLPLLRDAGVPAIGFYTGADLLRRPEATGVFNVRASYDQEIAALVSAASSSGVGGNEMCVVAQNDAFGEAALRGFARALANAPGSADTIRATSAVLAIAGHSARRNGLAPVGFFEREQPAMYHAFRSLKDWEARSGTRCRIVLTVGTYVTIGRFEAFSRLEGEDWIVAALSFTGAELLAPVIQAGPPDDRVVMMQVVPPLDATLPLLEEARKTLGKELGYVSLEGFIVGKLVGKALTVATATHPDMPLRESLAAVLEGRTLNVSGLELSFDGDNQALDAVHLTHLSEAGWQPLTEARWRDWAPARRFDWLTKLLR